MSKVNEYKNILEDVRKEVNNSDVWIASFDVIPVREMINNDDNTSNIFLKGRVKSKIIKVLYCGIFLKLPMKVQNVFRKMVGKNPK